MDYKNNKAQTRNHKWFGIIAILVFCVVFVVAIPLIIDVNNPADGTTTSNKSIELNFNITEANLKEVKFNWNNTNYTIFDDSLVLAFNFNNLSALGENDTHVYDISGNGNNGTVKFLGNVTWNSSGKYDGAFDFGGNEDHGHIESEDFVDSFNETGFTASGWFYPKAYSGDSGWKVAMSKFDGGNNGFELRWSDSASEDGFKFQMIQNGTYADMCAVTQSTQDLNQWYHITVVFNATAQTCKLYTNGELTGTDSSMNGVIIGGDGVDNNLQVGRHSPYGRNFNGSVDEVRLWNASLSLEQIQQQYYSNLKKYDSDKWSLYVNQSNLTTNTTGIPYTYYACATNSSDSENCTSTRTITRVPIEYNITSNYSLSIGDVRNDFYGVNIQNPRRLLGGFNLDTNCNGTGDTASNSTWSQQAYLNGMFSSMRLDYYFASYYDGVNNLGFEDWSNTSVGFFDSYSGSGTRNWVVSAYSGGNGTSSQSTDSYSGSYSLNITGNNDYVAVFGDLVQVVEGREYNASIWLKGSGTVAMYFKRDSPSISCGVKSVALTSTWTQHSITCIASQNDTAHQIIISNIDSGEHVLMDDWDITEDGEELRWWRTSTSTKLQEQLKWNYARNKRNLVIFWSNNPTFLANWSHPNCLGNGTGDSSCPPYDYNVANNISLDALKMLIDNNQTLLSNLDLEFKNEPYGTHEGACDYDSITCALDYVEFYEQTYDTLKAYNSSVSMGGPSGFQMTTTPNILTTFFTNVSDKFEFVSAHPYSSNYKGSNNMYNYFRDIKNNCTALGGGDGCNRIINSEWNTYNKKNVSNGQSDDFKSEIACAYEQVLNYLPNNASMNYYHWSDTNSYFNCPSRYHEYPSFWSGISEAGLDNATHPVYYPSYTVTKNFATFCPAGATVYNSTSTTGDLVSVACKKGNMYNTIIINKGDEAINLTLNLNNFTESTIYDLETRNSFTVTDNSTNIGSIDQYEIIYLGSDLEAPIITIDSPLNTTYTSNTTYFNLTLSEEGDTCYYSLDGASNQTMTKQGTVIKFKAVNSSMTDGSHTVIFSCNDTWDNWNSSSVVFLVDLTNPNATLISPANNTYSNESSNNFTSNLTDNHGLANATIYIYNSVGSLVNQTTVALGNAVSYTWGLVVDLADNVYTWFVELFDTAGNSDLSENYTLTVDTTFSLINITYPTNINYSTNVSELNYTYTEINCDSVWYSNNSGSTNSTIENCGTNFTNVISVEGSNTWIVYINDSAGNENSTSVTFFKDTIFPLISITEPLNATFTFDTGLDVNYTYTEINPDSCWWTEDLGVTNNTLADCNTNITETWTEGLNTITVYINDTANNENSSSISFTLDTINPNIEYVSPTPSNNSNQSTDSIYVNYTTSDTNDIYSFINFDSSLVGWYRLEGNANDDSSYSNDGTVNAEEISNSRFGKGYDFNTTTLVNISNSASLNISNSITLSAWVKIDKYIAYDRIVAKSPPTNAYPYTIYGLLTDTNTTGTKKVRMELASRGVQHVIRSGSGITEGEWFLLTGTHDYSTNQTRLYLNGVLDNSTLLNSSEVEVNITTIDLNNEPITIGRANYADAGLDGKVDEVLIFNRSISAEEVMSLYNSSSTYHNFTSLSDGTHTFTSYAIDQAGNKNETSRSITTEDTNPIVTKYTPSSNLVTTTKTQTYLFSTSDASNITSCSLIFDGTSVATNNSINQSINHSFTYTHTDGTFFWSIECDDEYGNTGTTGNISIQFYTETGGGGGSSYSYYSQCYNVIDNECKYRAVYDAPCPDNYFTSLVLCESSLIEIEQTKLEEIVEIIKDKIEKILPSEEVQKTDTFKIVVFGLIGILSLYLGTNWYSNNKKRKNKVDLIYKE